ncbi:HVM00 protein, partial [Atractosteus spatula]|nr:HVM00 protein [Atractosteus spatula]
MCRYNLGCLFSLSTGLADCNSVYQDPPALFITKHNKTAKLSCSHNIKSYERMYWYQQNAKGAFKYLGYLNLNNPYPEDEFKDKITLTGDGRNKGILEISSITAADSSVYFCAASIHSAADHLVPLQKPF